MKKNLPETDHKPDVDVSCFANYWLVACAHNKDDKKWKKTNYVYWGVRANKDIYQKKLKLVEIGTGSVNEIFSFLLATNKGQLGQLVCCLIVWQSPGPLSGFQ